MGVKNKVEYKNKTYQCIKGKWYCLGERKPEMDDILNKLYKVKRYSTTEGNFKGYPILVILEYGESYNSLHDKEFRFGVEKAKIILECFEYLEYFANSSGIAKNLKIGKSYSVKDKYSVTKFNEFQGMYGRMIEEPYFITPKPLTTF